MRVLITGNLGYIGSVLNRVLLSEHELLDLVGYDSAFFAHALTAPAHFPECGVSVQYFGDVRDLTDEHLKGVDAVVHLAAVSNDPMGREFESVTLDVNRIASVRLATLAAQAGVSNFVYASSCSMYGQSKGAARNETDLTNPLTAYARSKIGTEDDLREADLGSMVVTNLRFATACGWSPRLRLDLVLNDFVACALVSREISVLSNGTPWRPLIDVEDMCRAISWAVIRSEGIGGKVLSVNIGSNDRNYQVGGLANAVANLIPGTRVSVDKEAPPDPRSYAVDFSLFENLAPHHQPQINLEQSILRLKDGLERMGFNDPRFRESIYMRLNLLRKHIDMGRLDKNLRWLISSNSN